MEIADAKPLESAELLLGELSAAIAEASCTLSMCYPLQLIAICDRESAELSGAADGSAQFESVVLDHHWHPCLVILRGRYFPRKVQLSELEIPNSLIVDRFCTGFVCSMRSQWQLRALEIVNPPVCLCTSGLPSP